MKSYISNSILLAAILSFTGCSQSASPGNQNAYMNPCKTVTVPQWTYDGFVGMSRITASGNKAQQRRIALQRAISVLLMTKGSANGKGMMEVNREFSKQNKNETLSKRFSENSTFAVQFENIKYDIRIVKIWEHPCTHEIYVKIEEK